MFIKNLVQSDIFNQLEFKKIKYIKFIIYKNQNFDCK